MDANDIRGRIRARIEVLGLSVSEVERRAGMPARYLHDLLSAKKDSMRGDAFMRLARALQTTERWLMHGAGSEQVTISPSGIKQSDATGAETLLSSNVSGIGDSYPSRIRLTSLDPRKGACSFVRAESADTQYAGVIVDPQISLPNNPYATSLAGHTEIDVLAKDLYMATGDIVAFILDAGGSAAAQKAWRIVRRT